MPQQTNQNPNQQPTSLEGRLLNAIHSEVPQVREAAVHLIESGGKRIRPKFAKLIGDFLGGVAESETIGVAAELVHTATLLHDDVLDESRVRRGRPSVHDRYGVKAAILGGDFLLARALVTLTQGGLFAATHSLTLAMSEIVEAEVLQNAKRFALDTTVDETRRIAEGKTGALFGWCGRAVAESLDLENSLVLTAEQLGRAIGSAFQIADDLLDFTDTAEAGKPSATDLHEGQLTLPVQLARAKNTELDEALKTAFASRTPAAFVAAYDLLRHSSARAQGLEEIQALKSKAMVLAKGLGASGATLNGFSLFFDDVTSRRS